MQLKCPLVQPDPVTSQMRLLYGSVRNVSDQHKIDQLADKEEKVFAILFSKTTGE